MLITRLLNKLQQDVQQTKKAYYTQVERACNAALQDMRVDTGDDKEHKVLRQKSMEYEPSEDLNGGTSDNLDLLVGEEVRPQTSVDSEKFFIPFELACKGDVAKITVTALDGIQKLVAYGEIIGDYPDPKTPTRRLIDRIVETICNCHSVEDCDEGVELQIIKALLTIVTSEQVQVHESVLLLVLRTCIIIHLTTKSLVNKRTARAMLTQMLHSIFQRMEVSTEELELEVNPPGTNMESMSSNDIDEFSDFQEWESECISLVGEYFSQFALSGSDLFPSASKYSPDMRRDINQNSEGLPSQSTLNGDCDMKRNGDEPEREGQTREFMVVSPEDALNPFLNESVRSLSFSSTGNSEAMITQKDAFLSFWTMTKLAVKPILRPPIENDNEKAWTESNFQQSALAFHLLKEILEKSGKMFKDSSIFINAMRLHLFNAIKDSGISQNLEIFKLEVEILMIIMKKFHDVLSEEIRDLWDVLIFPVFELPNAQPFPSDCSKIVLQCLKTISTDLNCFVNFFTSYDCNPELDTRPFQQLVLRLNKVVCEKFGNEQLAIEVITNLLNSMSAACPKLDDNNDEVEKKKLREIEREDESYFSDDDFMSNIELEGSDFLTCLHIFLANVPLPCGVLKLDWYVQKLAQRMMDTSSVNSFRTETADCWYALVYASLTLIADIRVTNCQGKSKMSRSQFRKLNRGINGCEPLDETYLSAIYDEIEENYSNESNNTSPADQPRWLKIVEKTEKEILDVIKSILESTSLLRSHFSLGKQLKHVKRMIKICGTSFLMALINALQNTNDTKLSDVCLDGIHSGIRVACILGLDSEREVYVQALAKLSMAALEEIRGKSISSKVVTKKTSTLTMTENGVTKTVVTTTTEMKCRSVDIILTLLDVGIAEGNHLGGSWLPILKFMSQLLSTPLLIESRNSSRSSSPVPPAEGAGGNTGWAAWAGSLRESLEKKLWDPTAKSLHPSVKESIANSVEKVFKRSEMLTGDAMTDFFQALCQVALHDMMNSETTKHLMYEKINEVADSNFYRPALQWSQIWQVVSDYFCHLACSSKEEISTLAIESIQKLVLKLLKKETLNGYRFQNHYLSPFKVIITNTRSEITREAVLGFIETVISLHGDLLLSGWIAVLSILVANISSHSNRDKDAGADSFRVLQHIVDKCQKGEVNLRNSFGSIVKALIDIASSVAPTLEMSEQAFRLLTQLAEIPYRHPKLLMEENDNKSYRVWSRGWKPILHELSYIIVQNTSSSDKQCEITGHSSDTSALTISWDVKTKALITLFEVIKNYGGSFEKDWWGSVFEVLFNIFNSIKFHEKQDIMASSTSTELAPSSSSSPREPPPPPSTSDGNYKYFYCYYYVQFAIFDVYIQYYDATGSYVFEELLKHLQWCICQDHEQIALSGLSCLQQLVTTLGRRFSVQQWDSILNVFQTMGQSISYDENIQETVTKQDHHQSLHNSQSPAIQAIVHLELLKIMEKVIFPRRKCSLAPLPQDEDVSTEKSSEDSAHVVNDLLDDGQVSRILELLIRSHEISKEQCSIATLQVTNSSGEASPYSGTNFIPHETLSLQIYWRILFGMMSQVSSPVKIAKDTVWQMILNSCIESCNYFVTIRLHEHRDAWTDLLCFGLHSILNLPQLYFEQMTSQLYPYFCEMMELDLLDRKICTTLREYLLVIGRNYNVASNEQKLPTSFHGDS